MILLACWLGLFLIGFIMGFIFDSYDQSIPINYRPSTSELQSYKSEFRPHWSKETIAKFVVISMRLENGDLMTIEELDFYADITKEIQIENQSKKQTTIIKNDALIDKERNVFEWKNN